MDSIPPMGHQDDTKTGHYARVNRVPSRQRDAYGTGYDVLETSTSGQNDSYSTSSGSRDDRAPVRIPNAYSTGKVNISNEQHQDFRNNHGASNDREPRKQTDRIQNTQLGADEFRANRMIQNRRHDAYRNNYGASETFHTSGAFTSNYHTRDEAIVSSQPNIYRPGHNSKMERNSNIHQVKTGYDSRETGIQSRYPDPSGYVGNIPPNPQSGHRTEFDVRMSRDTRDQAHDRSRGNVAAASHDRSRGNVADKSHDRSRGNGADYGRRWYPGYEQYLSENNLWKPPPSGSSRYADI
jgi:hypothetical protein